MASPVDKNIVVLLREKGKMRTSEIFDALPQHTEGNIKKRLGILTKDHTLERPKRGVYLLADAPTDTQTQFHERRKKFSSDARSAEDNEKTINTLINTYDEVLAIFQVWVLQNIASNKIDFEKQLLFIENFKWLTMIADKLMKRWNLEHHGYDTNSRQAQEDAKAKTEAKQKAALKDAPVEEQVSVIGSFDLETKQLIDNFPTLEELSEEEEKEITV
ncbi:hypothetical protein F4009_05595 [Candidatus Poribacteria bacterium]|nr:hypothetical protein [Candidatus Poribacteria bacterium]MYH83499.1 hypothetical protein [Candidatus Poribacteria bacterium]MYK93461.1 hypothetical protein [Candidatus Poribacteria bacterium]